MEFNLRTEIKINPEPFEPAAHGDNLLFIGSCFSENFSSRLHGLKFNTLSNPFGVSYNPVSISKQIERIVSRIYFKEVDLFKKEVLYNSFDLHGSFFNKDGKNLLNEINETIDTSNTFLQNVHTIFITLGTAWVYRLKENNEIVNNCHKFPTSHFTKELLSEEDIRSQLEKIRSDIHKLNPKARIVFTLSPVRHVKDGITENSISKSRLLSAISSMTDKLIQYFPAYEIMVDDLRDYRFYESDLLHPNDLAIEYIFSKFSEVFFTSKTKDILKEIESIQKSAEHKAFNADSDAHQKFIQSQLIKAKQAEKLYAVDLTQEIEKLEIQRLPE